MSRIIHNRDEWSPECRKLSKTSDNNHGDIPSTSKSTAWNMLNRDYWLLCSDCFTETIIKNYE